MSLFRFAKKPQPVQDLTWRRPASGLPMTDPKRFEELMGYFEEDAITAEEAWAARDRREEVFHV